MDGDDHAIHELIISNREMSNLIRIHDAAIAALQARVEHHSKQNERLELMVNQIGTDVSAVRIAVLNHIQNDEVAQNRILKTIIVAAFVNGLAIITWIASAWYKAGMPWPILPWL